MGWSAWLYDGTTTINIGFTGPEHTRNDGFKLSTPRELNEAGQVSGDSLRYNGVSTYLGQSAWLYDGATTIDIGLTGAEHTSGDGNRISAPEHLNQAGQVVGYSTRYNGGNSYLGRTVWLFDGTSTIALGFTGSEYTRNDGFKYSQSYLLNEAGQVSGHSASYDGGTHLGYNAWLFDGMDMIVLGLTDSEHTRDDGYRLNIPVHLNEAGQVSGAASRFNGGGIDLGQSAWFYDGTTTVHIGLTGSEYTSNDGYQESEPEQLNETGQVIGRSSRYNGGSTELGISAWLYDGTTTIDIGLTDSEHTRSDGVKSSGGGQLNEAGQVIGNSARFNGGGTELGTSAWIYDGATTLNISLFGAEYTRDDGYKQSFADQLNETGQVIGRSSRYNGGSTSLGYSAWLYDNGTMLDMGLTGAEHTRNDGLKLSIALQLNETGQVRGYSRRYNGGITQLGQDAWLYDAVLDQTFSMLLSTRSDGYA